MVGISPDVFVAEHEGPPRRRFWIARDGPAGSSTQVQGWAFIFDEKGPDGEWRVGWHTWERWFFEIMRYPPEYAPHPLVWRRESDGQIVALELLQPIYDGKTVEADQTPEEAGLR